MGSPSKVVIFVDISGCMVKTNIN